MKPINHYRMIDSDTVYLVKTNADPKDNEAILITQEQYEEELANIMKGEFGTVTMSTIEPDPTIGQEP